MPTSPVSDVIPLRKTTKRQLASVKGEASYDELVATLLEIVPPDLLRGVLARKRDAQIRTSRIRTLQAQRAPTMPDRSPEKQLLIARLSRARWDQRLRDGVLIERGPRLLAWNPPQEDAGGGVKIAWRPGRGFAPPEGAQE